VRTLLGKVTGFSVERYEEALNSARYLASPRALAFHGLAWTLNAPPVQELTREWEARGTEAFRICDWEAYTAQLDRLMGLTD
jgi:hypothetical protein